MSNTDIKNKFLLSIVDKNGIKQFNLHRLIKKIIFYSVLCFVLFVFIIFISIKLLAVELSDIQNQKNDTIDKYIDVYNKNESLMQQIDISKNKLKSINEKMKDLEDIIGISDNIKSNDIDSISFDLDNLNNYEKEMMLKIIPSYLPFTLDKYDITKLNNGLEFLIPFKTPIYATADGIIDFTRDEGTSGIGKFIKVVHPFGFTSIYGYLSSIKVKRGDIVSKGQIIGYSGKNNIESLFYDIRFIGSEVNIESFIKWNIDSFDIVFDGNNIINWDSLLWTFNDILEINNHKVLTQ